MRQTLRKNKKKRTENEEHFYGTLLFFVAVS